MSITGIGIIGAVAVVIIVILLYNSLVVKRNNVDNAFACIDTQLKKRFDLIPNLVAAVKEYMRHESSTLTQITELRAKAMSSASASEKMAYSDQAAGLMRNIMVQAENYPDLKAGANFLQLQRSLNEIEEQLSAARRTFNAAVTEYNNAIQCFPWNIFAAILGFRARELFSVSEAERQNPNVKDLFR